MNTSSTIADTIHRPFFLAGIVTVLTLGCVWGAINLFTIGVKESFSAISYSWVLAHGHAMVFGFVGFFIMGFAYQAVPRFKQTTLWRPRLALASLPLMIAGILVQAVAHLLSPPSLPLEIFASVIQLVAVAIFAAVMVQTIRLCKRPETYDRFLYSALAWFLIAAIANPIIFKLFELAGTREQRLFNLATFNIPYRDVQLLGLAVVMILGISVYKRFPLKYDPQYWGMVFPFGMYTVCTFQLSHAINFPPLLVIPRYFIYLALAGWIAASFGLMSTLIRAQKQHELVTHR